MFRWACCGLVTLLVASVGAPLAAQPKAAPPAAPMPSDPPPVPPSSSPSGRAIRPVYTLPGPPKLDLHGDPLPSGAVARYGTVRLRHGSEIAAMSFTHDGKFLCTASLSEDTLRLWDSTTGKEVARTHTPAQHVGLVRDGTVVLIDDSRIRVWQPSTNATRDLPESALPEGATPTALGVNPDGRSIALAANGKVLLIDLHTGKAIQELTLPGNAAPPMPGGNPAPAGPPAAKLVYSPDGRWLAGSGLKTGVWLWDLRTGKRVRTYRTDADHPDYAFSPDVTRIVVCGERLQLYSLDSEEEVKGFKHPEDLQPFAPRFSADGKLLYVIAGDASVQPLDAATGEQKEGYDAPEADLQGPFALAHDAAMAAAVDETGGIRIWVPKTGKGPEVKRLPVLRGPGVGADGKSVTAIDAANRLHTFDLATGKPGKVRELAVADDGLPATWDGASRRVAAVAPSGDELEVQFIDADAGKVVAKYPVNLNGGVPTVSFAPANRDRAALFSQTGVAVVNPGNGKTVRSFNPENAANGLRGAISPDGRLVAVATSPPTVWEVATGKKRLTLDAAPAGEVAFSADSRFLAAWEQAGGVVVVDLRTGAVARRLQGSDDNDGVSALAFSRDGKRVATGAPSGRVTVWDAATGDAVVPFGGHDGPVTGLAFSADGRRLVSTAQDGTALVWDVPDKPPQVASAGAAVDGFDEAFRLLGSAEPAQAQRGLDYLYRNPADAVKQADSRLAPPPATPAAKLRQLIDDLDSDDYETREAAVKGLEKLGGEAGPPLRNVARASQNPEARKLAGELLGRIDAPPSRPDDLRILRAVEALENLGTPESRTQLEKWAAGPAGHRLTAEAAAAVARLKANGGK